MKVTVRGRVVFGLIGPVDIEVDDREDAESAAVEYIRERGEVIELNLIVEELES